MNISVGIMTVWESESKLVENQNLLEAGRNWSETASHSSRIFIKLKENCIKFLGKIMVKFLIKVHFGKEMHYCILLWAMGQGKRLKFMIIIEIKIFGLWKAFNLSYVFYDDLNVLDVKLELPKLKWFLYVHSL